MLTLSDLESEFERLVIKYRDTRNALLVYGDLDEQIGLLEALDRLPKVNESQVRQAEIASTNYVEATRRLIELPPLFAQLHHVYSYSLGVFGESGLFAESRIQSLMATEREFILETNELILKLSTDDTVELKDRISARLSYES